MKTRPELLTKWLQSWKYQAIPNLPDKSAFGSSWRTWWNGIQPKWRQVSTEGALPGPLSAATISDSLDALKKGGVSGLVTVLIGLKWWMPLHGVVDKEWGAAVEDVTSSLQLMAKASGGTKRKNDGEPKPKQKSVTGRTADAAACRRHRKGGERVRRVLELRATREEQASRQEAKRARTRLQLMCCALVMRRVLISGVQGV